MKEWIIARIGRSRAGAGVAWSGGHQNDKRTPNAANKPNNSRITASASQLPVDRQRPGSRSTEKVTRLRRPAIKVAVEPSKASPNSKVTDASSMKMCIRDRC